MAAFDHNLKCPECGKTINDETVTSVTHPTRYTLDISTNGGHLIHWTVDCTEVTCSPPCHTDPGEEDKGDRLLTLTVSIVSQEPGRRFDFMLSILEDLILELQDIQDEESHNVSGTLEGDYTALHYVMSERWQ